MVTTTYCAEEGTRVPTREDFARAFVRQGGYDPDSEHGIRRVKAILIAAAACESYEQFTRAAYAALEPDFGSVPIAA